MNTSYATTKDAVFGLIQAYISLEIDEIVDNKDFELDSRFFFEDLGLPVSEKQQREAITAFEMNFQSQLSEGVPDYRPVQFQVTEEHAVQDDFVIVTLSGRKDENRFELKIPVFQRTSRWIVVVHPAYDHL